MHGGFEHIYLYLYLCPSDLSIPTSLVGKHIPTYKQINKVIYIIIQHISYKFIYIYIYNYIICICNCIIYIYILYDIVNKHVGTQPHYNPIETSNTACAHAALSTHDFAWRMFVFFCTFQLG